MIDRTVTTFTLNGANDDGGMVFYTGFICRGCGYRFCNQLGEKQKA
jgi:hypothetical protein